MNRDPAADTRQLRALKLREAHYVELATYASWQGCTKIEAQEVANDSLAQLTIHEFNQDAEPIKNPRAWLYEVARRKTLELFRKRRWHQQLTELPNERLVDPSQEYAEGVEVLDAMQRLSDNHRRTLVLSVRGYSNEEIAEVLDCTPEAAKQRLSRARKALRHKLGMHTSLGTANSSKRGAR